MRISDWSSDVCSSDLISDQYPLAAHLLHRGQWRNAHLPEEPRRSGHGENGSRASQDRRMRARLGDLLPRVYRAWRGIEYHERGPAGRADQLQPWRSEEHTSELQSLMRNSYAVFCLKKNKT